MSWLTDAELGDALAAAVGLDPDAPLPPHLAGIVPWASRMAEKAIRAALINRGFSAAQVDDWEMAGEYHERLGVCMGVKRAAMRGEGYNTQAAVEDCKEALGELQTVTVVIADEATDPANGQVTTGEYSDDDDIHKIDDTL